jgi:uncharacterized membrane protein
MNKTWLFLISFIDLVAGLLGIVFLITAFKDYFQYGSHWVVFVLVCLATVVSIAGGIMALRKKTRGWLLTALTGTLALFVIILFVFWARPL